MMKKTIIIILLCILSLTACARRAPVYREDIAVKQVQEEVDGMLYHTDSLISYDPEEVRFYLDLPEEYCSDCIVRAQTSSVSIDEYGIFHCKTEEEAEKLEDLLEDYLERTLEGKREWLQSYNPAELQKLERSDVERFGCYVFYGILDPPTERLVTERVEGLLRDK
ncbi:MAG: DUF4358 domain-containing protein [Clostridia bacterium]|nr:DUF4358 domain-containing protein [Clostridia bacterium]